MVRSFLNPIFNIPERNNPEPNKIRQLAKSLNIPKKNLLNAYAKFCELMIIPVEIHVKINPISIKFNQIKVLKLVTIFIPISFLVIFTESVEFE